MARKKRGRDVHGIVVVDKPLGLSSNQVLQRVKRLFNANKAGHTGALDPLATGVLPICLGEATKFSQLLLDADKGYETTATLGEVRSTGDAEGDVIERFPSIKFSESELDTILQQFLGPVEQVPPMFSALKLQGQPLYKLARPGMSAEDMQAIAEKKRRTIHIHELQCTAMSSDEVDLKVRCSKGTYIRTLVEDIGRSLGSGAYVSRLHRILSAPFSSAQMVSLEHLQQVTADQLDQYILPLEMALPAQWPEVDVMASDIAALRQGQKIRYRPEALVAFAESGSNTAAATTVDSKTQSDKQKVTDASQWQCPSVQLRAAEYSGRPCIGLGRVADGYIYPTRVLNRVLGPE